jgi:hypothetical protein
MELHIIAAGANMIPLKKKIILEWCVEAIYTTRLLPNLNGRQLIGALIITSAHYPNAALYIVVVAEDHIIKISSLETKS